MVAPPRVVKLVRLSTGSPLFSNTPRYLRSRMRSVGTCGGCGRKPRLCVLPLPCWRGREKQKGRQRTKKMEMEEEEEKKKAAAWGAPHQEGQARSRGVSGKTWSMRNTTGSRARERAWRA